MPHRARLAAITLLSLCALQGAFAQTYPTKTITLIVPTAPAGGTDTVARLVAQQLGKALKQTVIIDNKAGANGTLGTEQAARAAPDGHTLLFTYAAAMVVNPSLYANLHYEVQKDFMPIVQVGRAGNLLLVRADGPARSLKDFIEFAKARPGKLNYCSWGNGSGGHLTMESLMRQASLKMSHAPYKGVAPCLQDLMGGQIDIAFGDVTSTLPHVRSGRLRALATSGPGRLPQLAEVPTLSELGYPFTIYSWYGLFAPAGTSPAIVGRLNAEVNKLFKEPEALARFRELNLEDLPINTPEQFAKTIAHDLAGWRQLILEVGVKLE